jgi:glyoxylase-like metal-dependent hydrolase (beta-lactamase superfamily II)
MNEPLTSTIQRIEGAVMAVNSYLVHGPDGLVLVDAQLTISDATAVRAAIDRTGVPLAGVLITHPHPDHYAGAAIIVDGDDTIPIIATTAVDEIIRRDDSVKDRIVGPMMGAEWPSKRTFPNRLVATGDHVTLGGVTLIVRDVGACESHADTLWTLDDTSVFAGDLAYHNMHAYLADGNYGEWIDSLDVLHNSLRDDVTLYVGHGLPGSKALLVRQRQYVEQFVDAVRRSASLSVDNRSASVTAAMRTLEPTDQLLFLMQLSIEPVLATIRDAPVERSSGPAQSSSILVDDQADTDRIPPPRSG